MFHNRVCRISKEDFAETLLLSDIEFFQKMKLLKTYVLSLDIVACESRCYNYFIDVQIIRLAFQDKDYGKVCVHLQDLIWKGGGSLCCIQNRVAVLTVLGEILSKEKSDV